MANRIKGVVLALSMAAFLSACDTMVGEAATATWDWTTDAASATGDFITSPFTDDEMAE